MDKIAQNLGTVNPPPGVSAFGADPSGFPKFLNVILQSLVMIAGVYALFNFVTAGYLFLSAGDDPKKVQDAWSKIWQTMLGVTVAAGAFVLAAILGLLVFGDADAILQMRIFTP